MRTDQLDVALPAGTDLREYARVLARAREAALAGRRPGTAPRRVIEESWWRARDHGVDPDRGAAAPSLGPDEVEHRRATCGLTESALATLRRGLVGIADKAAHIMVITDADGRVLWREGSRTVRRQADRLGFAEGATWAESVVGTNAIGTALVARRPLQVYSTEHYVQTHHPWTCSAAPIRDVRTGWVLGAVDVSGPAATAHPSTLALVDAVARLAESQQRQEHLAELDRLRGIAAPLLARIDGRALVTDPHGWVAASVGLSPVERVLLPDEPGDHQVWLPTLGLCAVEPLPGGFLVRPAEGESPSPVRAVLDVRHPTRPRLTLHQDSGVWTHSLSPRHAEILFVLARHPAGRTAAELAADLFGDPSRTITVRAEMSRLRKQIGRVIDHRPYRFADDVEVTVEQGAEPSAVLPHSSAPALARLRRPDG
ncbi:transcriptional regulator [Saccharopolyspora subtropica]|uniref:GAF domain-containing protein n=1 Tax=Saccharopolyspora thermophila TaxID=89367 RepID=A0A917NI55_9PSEU|nr:GAF domain-containing protein [Saccharopolyspora subtropica]GGJ02223.1 transcriptional regulator [Saccharopolyspora subtropica]